MLEKEVPLHSFREHSKDVQHAGRRTSSIRSNAERAKTGNGLRQLAGSQV